MRILQNIYESVKPLILTVVVIKFFLPIVILTGVVPSSSMEPTLQIGDRLLCTNIYWHKPQYGDIVVFYPNEEESIGEEEYYIKRLIGKPNDKIKIENGTIYRNGILLEEPYVVNKYNTNQSFVVPEDKYFMLGDNRSNSSDARFWENPFIDEEQLKFVATFRFFPFNRIGIPE